MTAGYTAVELDGLRHIMLESQPANPSSGDGKNASEIIGVATAAQFNGMLLKIMFRSCEPLLLKLNCVIALELMATISNASNGWHPRSALKELDAASIGSATEGMMDISSFASGSDPNGLPVNLTDGERTVMVFLPTQFAVAILSAISAAGEAAGWWDSKFILRPARGAEEDQIQREAAALINQFKGEAAVESARRATCALEVGDKFNHELWQRVGFAVREFDRTMPADGNPLTHCVLDP